MPPTSLENGRAMDAPIRRGSARRPGKRSRGRALAIATAGLVLFAAAASTSAGVGLRPDPRLADAIPQTVGGRGSMTVDAAVSRFETLGPTSIRVGGYLSSDGNRCRRIVDHPLLVPCTGLELWNLGADDALYSSPFIPLSVGGLKQSDLDTLASMIGAHAWGTPIVITGHFHDVRAGSCPDELRTTCEEMFVVETLDWAGAAASETTLELPASESRSVGLGPVTLRIPASWSVSPALDGIALAPGDHPEWAIKIAKSARQRYDQTLGLVPGYPKASYVTFDYDRSFVVWTVEEGRGAHDRITRLGVNAGGESYEVVMDWGAVPAEAASWMHQSFRAIAATVNVSEPTDPVNSIEGAR